LTYEAKIYPPNKALSNNLQCRLHKTDKLSLRDHHLTYEAKIYPPNKALSNNLQCRLHRIDKFSLQALLGRMELSTRQAQEVLHSLNISSRLL
jgi:hypothetical protein